MGLSWIKIGSRTAVVIIIYLLLSIPDTKYQYFKEEVPSQAPTSKIKETLITNHAKSILSINEQARFNQYDSLVRLLTAELDILKSEIIGSDNSIILRVTKNLGYASALAGLSTVDSRAILENLWQWRQYLKEQSLFWNIKDEEVKLQMASTINFVSLCEDFIISNRNLSYSITAGDSAIFNSRLPSTHFKSGDILLSNNDISYSFLEQAKLVPQLTVSLGLILVNHDSSFYISTTPSEGLHVIESDEFAEQPFAKRLQLRLRNDLPELISNPGIPQQATRFIYDVANNMSINYDFNVNLLSHNAITEIELLEFSFEGYNLNFITSFSPINNTYVYGLSRLGIENKIHPMASEILFHPAIELVGQQATGSAIRSRNLQMSANLAGLSAISADLMKSLRWKLPYYRLLKGYSRVAGLMGREQVIPSGMAPETAIIVNYLSDQSDTLMPKLADAANRFQEENKYYPTYGMLSEMAMSLMAAERNK